MLAGVGVDLSVGELHRLAGEQHAARGEDPPSTSEIVADARAAIRQGRPLQAVTWDFQQRVQEVSQAIAAEVLLKEGVPLDVTWERHEVAGAEVGEAGLDGRLR